MFVSRPNAPVAEQFQQRLTHAFSNLGLDSEAYCVMLPPVSQADYWNLNQLSDAFWTVLAGREVTRPWKRSPAICQSLPSLVSLCVDATPMRFLKC